MFIPIGDTIPCINKPVVTWTLIGINVVLFLSLKLLDGATFIHILKLYGLVPRRYFDPAWAAGWNYPARNYLPLLSHMFLHASWSHLLFNTWLIWIFADNIEDMMGKPRFLIFYLLCGVVAGLIHMAFNPDSQSATVGASGAIAGVLGAYFFLYPYGKVIIWLLFLPIFIQVPAVAFVGVWVIFQLNEATTAIVVGQPMDVAWWGHLGGFACGCLLYRFFLIETKKPERA
ncbi:MAG: rhomboid family intramembrane serine protease [Methylococcales bacterium]